MEAKIGPAMPGAGRFRQNRRERFPLFAARPADASIPKNENENANCSHTRLFHITTHGADAPFGNGGDFPTA